MDDKIDSEEWPLSKEQDTARLIRAYSVDIFEKNIKVGTVGKLNFKMMTVKISNMIVISSLLRWPL